MRAVTHCDTEVSVLEREGVVDAIARHRDAVIASLQRTDHRALLFGCHAPEHIVVFDRVDERLGGEVLGQVPRVHEASGRPVGGGQARLRGQCPDRRRIVTRDDAHVHVLRTEILQCLSGVGA